MWSILTVVERRIARYRTLLQLPLFEMESVTLCVYGVTSFFRCQPAVFGEQGHAWYLNDGKCLRLRQEHVFLIIVLTLALEDSWRQVPCLSPLKDPGRVNSRTDCQPMSRVLRLHYCRLSEVCSKADWPQHVWDWAAGLHRNIDPSNWDHFVYLEPAPSSEIPYMTLFQERKTSLFVRLS